MIPATSDPRRFVRRWGTVMIIVAVASMMGIRACSVRIRSHGDGGRNLQSAGQSDDPAGDFRDDPALSPALAHDPLSAFENALCAWNEIRLGGTDGGGSVVVGDLHNNASRGGETRLEGDTDVYGEVTSAGTIEIGSPEGAGPTTVHGSIGAAVVIIDDLGEVRDFVDLPEWSEGVDLNGDGDLDDLDVGQVPAVVRASKRLVCGDETLENGATSLRIADGTREVEIGSARRSDLRDREDLVAVVYPDFRAYYEAASGVSYYPPDGDHVTSDIPGDGDGHYFTSANAFRAWINSHTQVDVLCWRCAGDGSIDANNATPCPECGAGGKVPAVEICGVFYVDDETLDLGAIETHLVVHGTLVVAEGNPYQWPPKSFDVPGSRAISVDHFPEKGSFVIKGPTRMHFTQTWRADGEDGTYVWRHRALRRGDDQQYVCAAVPEIEHAMAGYPAVVAASRIEVAPRGTGFASFAGDVGDEAVTLLQGVLFAGEEVRLGGRGGWRGEAIVFREDEARNEDDILDEAILRVDLNDDGDVLDRLRLADVTGRPVIRVERGRYDIDINNDGVLNTVVIGEDYGEFFLQNGHSLPILVHAEGSIVSDTIRIGAQCALVFHPLAAGSAAPAGFLAAHPQRSSANNLSLFSHIPSSR